MKLPGVTALFAFLVVVGVIAFTAIADHQERLPQQYFSLDKSKPWNEIAAKLDPRMSDGEYNEMRTRYFYDVVEPKLTDKSLLLGTYQEFMRATDRPWQWDRRASRGEPPRVVLPLFWVSAVYLMIFLTIWMWTKVFRPAGRILHDSGLAGIVRVVVHGRAGTSLHPSEQHLGAKPESRAADATEEAQDAEGKIPIH